MVSLALSSRFLFTLSATAGLSLLATGCRNDEECAPFDPVLRHDSNDFKKAGLPVAVGEFNTPTSEEALRNLSKSLTLIVEGRQGDLTGCSRVHVDNLFYWHFPIENVWELIAVLGVGFWDSYPTCLRSGDSNLEDHVRSLEELSFQFGAIYVTPGELEISSRDSGEDLPYTLSIPLYKESPHCRANSDLSNEFFASTLRPELIRMTQGEKGWEGIVCSQQEGSTPCDPPTDEIRIRLIPDPDAILVPQQEPAHQ